MLYFPWDCIEPSTQKSSSLPPEDQCSINKWLAKNVFHNYCFFSRAKLLALLLGLILTLRLESASDTEKEKKSNAVLISQSSRPGDSHHVPKCSVSDPHFGACLSKQNYHQRRGSEDALKPLQDPGVQGMNFMSQHLWRTGTTAQIQVGSAGQWGAWLQGYCHGVEQG